MYSSKLLDAYKEQMNYVQYKQIAHDLGVSPQMLTDIRKGRNFLKENQILMLAEAVGEDKEKALVGLALDKAKTYEAHAIWSDIAKKFNGLGLTSISMTCTAFMVSMDAHFNKVSEFALCWLMLNKV
ncbi:hypothetical protein ACOMICROBIO_GDFFDHBD_02238 [Vibrio sp. B1REV9]|uniref:DUF3693 domain-containing protein n=1 Tax=Vibrio sp. B1REV9 TaxID=2751179 RepID=UPI001AFB865B|nr:DUF3693 domain-containing protein [Vibrio sp. B1REV9]CAE6925234.1 hypothetical protein ACOMICROBIO_GDFFDHBD_02238 [Vibrio sp. B1REV9]